MTDHFQFSGSTYLPPTYPCSVVSTIALSFTESLQLVSFVGHSQNRGVLSRKIFEKISQKPKIHRICFDQKLIFKIAAQFHRNYSTPFDSLVLPLRVENSWMEFLLFGKNATGHCRSSQLVQNEIPWNFPSIQRRPRWKNLFEKFLSKKTASNQKPIRH